MGACGDTLESCPVQCVRDGKASQLSAPAVPYLPAARAGIALRVTARVPQRMGIFLADVRPAFLRGLPKHQIAPFRELTWQAGGAKRRPADAPGRRMAGARALRRLHAHTAAATPAATAAIFCLPCAAIAPTGRRDPGGKRGLVHARRHCSPWRSRHMCARRRGAPPRHRANGRRDRQRRHAPAPAAVRQGRLRALPSQAPLLAIRLGSKSPAGLIMSTRRGREGSTRSCRPLGRRGGGAGALCSWCGRPREAMTPGPDWASREPPARLLRDCCRIRRDGALLPARRAAGTARLGFFVARVPLPGPPPVQRDNAPAAAGRAEQGVARVPRRAKGLAAFHAAQHAGVVYDPAARPGAHAARAGKRPGSARPVGPVRQAGQAPHAQGVRALEARAAALARPLARLRLGRAH